MVYSYEINGLPVQTGDLICTIAGEDEMITGHFWWFIGRLLPGAVDHIAVYVGPEGRCVESAARGVTVFTIPNGTWNCRLMFKQRGPLVDTLHGVAYPLANVDWEPERQFAARAAVAEYCLAQAKARKPYNFNFLDTGREDAFYCSHLAYQAWLRQGIDLNTNIGMANFPGTNTIIFPQEIWEGLPHKEVESK